MQTLIGNPVGLYCPELAITEAARLRIYELHKLKDKTYHPGRWKARARRAEIAEARPPLVAAYEPGPGRQAVYIVDLARAKVLTVFKYRRGVKYLELEGLLA